MQPELDEQGAVPGQLSLEALDVLDAPLEVELLDVPAKCSAHQLRRPGPEEHADAALGGKPSPVAIVRWPLQIAPRSACPRRRAHGSP